MDDALPPPPPPAVKLARLLVAWHTWRRHYTHERGYARALWSGIPGDDSGDADEGSLCRSIEREIERLPHEQQRALQHVARDCAEGAQLPAALGEPSTVALAVLHRRLLALGLV